MKKLLKILLGLVAVVLILALAGYSLIAIRGIPTYDAPKKLDLKVESTPERVEQGEKLAGVLCIKCHTPNEGIQMTGRELTEMPPEFGKIYSRNITKDKVHGIGNWTDGELVYFLRTGVKPTGVYAPIWMPKFAHMSDEDLYSIIAYLRSDKPAVQASTALSQDCDPSWLSKFLCNVAFKPLPYPEKPIIAPDTNDLVAYGRYMVAGRYDCFPCHSADFKTVNIFEPEKSVGYMGGGNILYTLEGKQIHTANITKDEATGIGSWTFEQFSDALRFGKKPDGTTTRYPMFPYTRMDDLEVSSIWAYLKTIPKISNRVDRNVGN